MAEVNETQEPSTTPAAPVVDEAKMAELIRKNVSDSLQEAIKTAAKQAPAPPRVEPKVDDTPKDDFWDDVINPRLTKHQQEVQNATLRSQAAEDKIDFYSSDDWLVGANDWLTSDAEDEQRSEKAEIRTRVEELFKTQLESGRGLPRADILKYVLAEKAQKDMTKFQESIGKRQAKRQAAELANASRKVDISAGNIANFKPEQIHAMSYEKVVETFGDVAF